MTTWHSRGWWAGSEGECSREDMVGGARSTSQWAVSTSNASALSVGDAWSLCWTCTWRQVTPACLSGAEGFGNSNSESLLHKDHLKSTAAEGERLMLYLEEKGFNEMNT